MRFFCRRRLAPPWTISLQKVTRKNKSCSGCFKDLKRPYITRLLKPVLVAATIKFKISGGTRSELGQQVRDVFLSLKQTCRKLGINFMSFLQDRVRRRYEIPRLATIIRERALAAAKAPPNLPASF